MIIPYTVDRRPDTGVTNVTMGIWLFLASEVMLFGALFSSYALLRVSAPDWPSGSDVLDLPLALANTVVLALMGAFAWRARAAATAAATRRTLLVSSAFAIVFLVLKAVEYRADILDGIVPSVSTFIALYFVLTGLHAVHVLGGLIANGWVMAGVRRVPEAMTMGRVRALTLYWAFVDVVWIAILVLMYLT